MPDAEEELAPPCGLEVASEAAAEEAKAKESVRRMMFESSIELDLGFRRARRRCSDESR